MNDHIDAYFPDDIGRIIQFCREDTSLYDGYNLHKEMQFRTGVEFTDILNINSVTNLGRMTAAFSEMYTANYSSASNLPAFVNKAMLDLNFLASLPDSSVLKDRKKIPCQPIQEFSLRNLNITIPDAIREGRVPPFNAQFPFMIDTIRKPWEAVCPHADIVSSPPFSQDICEKYLVAQSSKCNLDHLATDCATTAKDPQHLQEVGCLWDHALSFSTLLYQRYDDGNCTAYLKKYFSALEMDDEFFEVDAKGFYPLLLERFQRLRVLDGHNRTSMAQYFCAMKDELSSLEAQTQQHMSNITQLYTRLNHINRQSGPFQQMLNYSHQFHDHSKCSALDDSVQELYLHVCSDTLNFSIILTVIVFGLAMALVAMIVTSGYAYAEEHAHMYTNVHKQKGV
jgi:hypothetical protein